MKIFCGYASSVTRTGWPTWTLAMSTSFRLTRMMSDLRSATVKMTVPALKEETPEVTVSPSSTPFLMTTPVMGEVTRAFCEEAFPEIGIPRSSTIW